MYIELLEKYAARNATVIDNWWSSESGSPISGLALRSSAGLSHGSNEDNELLKVKPGSAGKPMPGFDVRIVDDEGIEVKQGEMGNIVLAMPLAPTGFITLFEDDMRFYKGYLKRFNGKWMDTGDAGMIDEDGYVHIMSRSDDIINVAAHRFSTGMYPFHDVKSSKSFRRNRAGHPVTSINWRSMRGRYSRCNEGTPTIRLHHALIASGWQTTPSSSVPRIIRRSQQARTGTDRRNCFAGWYTAGTRHDPKDKVGQDIEALFERAC